MVEAGHRESSSSGGAATVSEPDAPTTLSPGGTAEVGDVPEPGLGTINVRMLAPRGFELDTVHYALRDLREVVLFEGDQHVAVDVTDEANLSAFVVAIRLPALRGGALDLTAVTGGGTLSCRGLLGPVDIVGGKSATYLIRLSCG